MTIDETKRRVRLTLLLDGLAKAGMTPASLGVIHFLAYLSNALSPVWDLVPMERKVLKRLGGPFYPQMQADLDRLVGMGVVAVDNLRHTQGDDGRWRIEASYSLRYQLAAPILEGVEEFDPGSPLATFLRELCLAMGALPLESLARASDEDANYADPTVGLGNVVDFAEWQDRNFAANAAHAFRELVPGELLASRGEMLHLYVRHLGARLARG